MRCCQVGAVLEKPTVLPLTFVVRPEKAQSFSSQTEGQKDFLVVAPHEANRVRLLDSGHRLTLRFLVRGPLTPFVCQGSSFAPVELNQKGGSWVLEW